MKNIIRTAVFVLVSLTAAPVRGQWLVDADASWMNDDNVENNSVRLADRILSGAFRLSYEHAFASSDLLVSAGVQSNVYSNVTDRTFVVPDLRLTLGSFLGDEEAVRGEVGLEWLSRNGRGDYAFLDYSNLGLTASIAFEPSEVSSFAGSYQYRSFSFSDLSPFNYSEHTFLGSASWSFESRTTLILRTGIGTKLYGATTTDSTAHVSSRVQQSGSTAGAIQTWGSLRIAQGITEHTGLNLTLHGQMNLRSNPTSLTGTDMLVSDEEIFEDRYGFEGLTVSAMVSQVLWEGTMVRFAYTIQQKSYVTLAAYDLTGAQIADHRSDRRTTLLFSLGHEFSFGSLQAVYEHIANQSNDPFFNYPNSAMTVQFSVPFGR